MDNPSAKDSGRAAGTLLRLRQAAFRLLCPCVGRRREQAESIKSDVCEPSDDSYPTFPPPAPEAIIQNAAAFLASVQARTYAAPRGVFEDNSLFALYRLYEFVVLDKRFAYRNILEWFWRQHSWSICDIADPQDPVPSRYVFLACLTKLLARSFNERISNGLRRDASPLITMDELERHRAEPESSRPYEFAPSWAEKVPSLSQTLLVPTEDGVYLEEISDERADPEFLAKNIVLWTPHFSFT